MRYTVYFAQTSPQALLRSICLTQLAELYSTDKRVGQMYIGVITSEINKKDVLLCARSTQFPSQNKF
jgi:hypothetical protein